MRETSVEPNPLMDGIFVGAAVMLILGGFAVMFNGALSRIRNR